MNKILINSVLILVLFIYNYRTIHDCFKLSDTSIVLFDDCEEKNSESKKSDGKEDKKDFIEYITCNKFYGVIYSSKSFFIPQLKTAYAGSDYSLSIYSPPDVTII